MPTIYAVNGKEPVAAWIPSLDTAGNGTTTLTDLVGSNHGTLTNMDAATDWVADTDAGGVRALDFDGLVSKDDEVRIATSSTAWSLPSLGNKVSISAWVKSRSFPTYSGNKVQEIWQHGPNNTTNGEWYLMQSTGQTPVFQIWQGGPYNATGTTVLATNTWYHVVGTWDGAQIKIYVNGVLEATTAAAISPANLSATTRIGRLGVTNYEYSIDGFLDDVRIWNSSIGVLDASDVAALYIRGRGATNVTTPIVAVNSKTPVAAWVPSISRGDWGSTRLTDLVGGSNGTLTNMSPASDWTDDGSGLWSLDFDGSNDYVALSSGVALGTLHSVSEWVYCGVIPTQYDFNGSMGESGSATTCPIAFQSSNIMYSSSTWGAVVPRTYVVGEWLHVVSIRNGLSVSFYVNGSLLGSDTLPTNPSFTLGRLGARNLIAGIYFRGRLDDIRVFDSALTAPDVAYLYNSGNGRGVQPATGNPAGILQNNIQSMRLGL